MNRRILGFCLAASLLLGGLSGCAGNNATNNTDDQNIFLTSQTLTDDGISMTVELATLSDAIMATHAADNGNTMNRYYPEGSDGDSYLYLDCVLQVRNTGKRAIDLTQVLYLYCNDGTSDYTDHMVLVEAEDGTVLQDAGTLEPGQSARVHYALTLPQTVSWSTLSVSVMMPSSRTVYTAPLNKLLPKANRSFSKETPLTTESGAVLTLQSASSTDEIEAITDEGDDDSIKPTVDGDVLVDVAIEVENTSDSKLAVNTLYGGQLLQSNFNAVGVVVIEADDELTYAGSIDAGKTAMTHLIFELTEEPTESDLFYLYVDGTFYSIYLDADPADTTDSSDEEDEDE